jgi:hypothetical protein
MCEEGEGFLNLKSQISRLKSEQNEYWKYEFDIKSMEAEKRF